MAKCSRRRVVKGAGAAGLVSLAGCASSNKSGSSNSGSETGSSSGGGGSEGSVSITYRDREQRFAPVGKAFNESHSNIDLKTSIKPEQSKYRSLVAQITAGNAPTVVGLDQLYLARFVSLGALADLSTYEKSASYTSDIFEPLKTAFITWKGKTYGMPYWIDTSLYLYNKTHYEKAGLDPSNPPTTWSDFLAACDKLKQAGYTPLSNTLGLLGLETFFFLPFAWAGGATFFNDKRTKTLIDQKPAVEALKFFKEISDKGYSTDQTQNQHFTYPAFESGKASMAFSGAGVGPIRKKAPKVFKNMGTALFPKPRGGKNVACLGGNCAVLTKQAKKHQQKFSAAKSFVDWIHSKDGMSTIAKDTGYLPSRKSGFKLQYYQNHWDIYSTYKSALTNGHAMPKHPQYDQMQEPLNNAITRALKGKQSPKKALSEAATKINQVL